jgi:hypothetical protein
MLVFSLPWSDDKDHAGALFRGYTYSYRAGPEIGPACSRNDLGVNMVMRTWSFFGPQV